MSTRKGETTITVESICGINCDNCEKDIPLVFPDGSNKSAQGTNMLHVFLEGGYGEYIDGASSIHLCSDCAQTLREAFPLIGVVLDRTFIGDPDWRDQVKVDSQAL